MYPVSDWSVVEPHPDPTIAAASESVFALGNGYMGVRGSIEEGFANHAPGLFVNGYYEQEPIVYGESAYGFATHHQRMVSLGDPTIIRATVNGTPVELGHGDVDGHRRELDLKTGMLGRTFRWSDDDVSLEITSGRIVSFRRLHVMAIQWTCRFLNGSGTMHVTSLVQGRPSPRIGGHDPRVGQNFSRRALMLGKREVDDRVATIRHRTRNSRFDIITAVANVIETDVAYRRSLEQLKGAVGHSFEFGFEAGQQVTITKYVSTYTSLDYPRARILGLVRQDIESARRAGFQGLCAEQKNYLLGFWGRSDITLEGDKALQQSIRFNAFHLIQAAGRTGHTSVGAKGLTGPGYEGHYFWDTEIYVMPFLTYTNPGIARALLEYRYRTLPRARKRAETLRHRGALYPWRTINGDEASAYFPAGTAQYHINADIIYAMRQYVRATGDRWFLLKRGAEMLFETARFWLDLGCFIDGRGFCFNEVTGPDEYTALVNNNAFTNLMAADHLAYAAHVYERMQEGDRAMLEPLVDRIGLDPSEPKAWSDAARAVFIPYDEARGLYAQDDSFFHRERWDFEATPKDRYPLLLHYHPLTIYRFQVLKQPDLVLALLLQGDKFTAEEKRRNFEFYDPLTTGDSSLSPCIQSIIAAEIGETELAYRYFMKTARMDLDNVNGNVSHGVHTAAMAGTWLSLLYGFGGMRDFGGHLSFAPSLPSAWSRLVFRVLWKGTMLEVQTGRNETSYRLPRSGELSFTHNDEALTLTGTDPLVRPNRRTSK